MWDFLIALFGIPYYVFKYLNEVHTHKFNEQALQNRLEWEKNKYNELAPSKDEQDRLFKLAFYNPSRAMPMVEDALARIFGADYKMGIKRHYKGCVEGSPYSPMPGNFKFWLYQLLLAKSGKLDPEMRMRRFELGDSRHIKVNVGFCREIERYLHQAGHTELRLYSPLTRDKIDSVTNSSVLTTMMWGVFENASDYHRLW